MKIFTPKTLEFLFENRLNDSREWFLEHHEQYEQWVLEPLRELAQSLAPTALAIDPEVVSEPQVGRTISRIRRDTRFTHDKSLYRDNMWIVFKRGKMHGTEVPGLYFDISNQGVEYGCGFYHCSTTVMSAIRQMVLEDAPSYRKAQKALDKQTIFHVEGECYKRPHYPDQSEPKRQWLERRNLCLLAQSADEQLLYSDRLAQTISEHLALLQPIYHFLLNACKTAEGNGEKFI